MKEGKLVFDKDTKRWSIDGVTFSELTSGDVVEVFAFGDWLLGRIEHSHRLGYSFLDPDTGARLVFVNGLRARLPHA